MEQNGEARNKSIPMWSINISQRGQEYTIGKEYSINGVGKIWRDTCKKPETRPFYTIYKNKLRWIKDLNVLPQTIKLLEENIGSKLFDIALSTFFLLYILEQGK